MALDLHFMQKGYVSWSPVGNTPCLQKEERIRWKRQKGREREIERERNREEERRREKKREREEERRREKEREGERRCEICRCKLNDVKM